MINKTKKEIEICLRYYIPNKYWVLNDWDTIIDRCEEVEENIFQFRCSFFSLYFDEDMHPVNYGKMVVCERRNNRVYYDFQKDMEFRTEPMIPLGEYEWENQYNWGR